MKKCFFVAAVMLLMVSCLGDEPSVKRSYRLYADFEFSDDYSHYKFFGTDSLYFDENGGLGIGYDLLAFLHKLNDDKTAVDGGFLLSCYKYPDDGMTEGLVNTWRTNVKLAEKQTRLSYLVFRDNPDEGMMPEHDIHFTALDYGMCQMAVCYVSNTVEVADAVAENFDKGDRLTLKATGYLDGNKTGHAEIHLADFSAQKDSIVTEWTPFDLSALGSVEYVDFDIISTNEAVPGYACIDFVCADISIEY